jgi:hypothetical protein
VQWRGGNSAAVVVMTLEYLEGERLGTMQKPLLTFDVEGTRGRLHELPLLAFVPRASGVDLSLIALPPILPVGHLPLVILFAVLMVSFHPGESQSP